MTEEAFNSEQAFEVMDRVMPGGEAIRVFIHEYREEEEE